MFLLTLVHAVVLVAGSRVWNLDGLGFVEVQPGLLGEGGSAIVFRATLIDTDEEVAIKVERPHQTRINPWGVADLGTLPYEVKISKMMELYSGFPRVVGHGSLKGKNWLATEYIGPSLAEVEIRSVSQLCHIAMQVLERLDALFTRGFVMYDVHSGNFLLHPDGTVYVIDLAYAFQWREATNRYYTPLDDVLKAISMFLEIGRKFHQDLHWLKALHRELVEENSEVPDMHSLDLVFIFERFWNESACFRDASAKKSE